MKTTSKVRLAQIAEIKALLESTGLLSIVIEPLKDGSYALKHGFIRSFGRDHKWWSAKVQELLPQHIVSVECYTERGSLKDYFVTIVKFN